MPALRLGYLHHYFFNFKSTFYRRADYVRRTENTLIKLLQTKCWRRILFNFARRRQSFALVTYVRRYQVPGINLGPISRPNNKLSSTDSSIVRWSWNRVGLGLALRVSVNILNTIQVVSVGSIVD